MRRATALFAVVIVGCASSPPPERVVVPPSPSATAPKTPEASKPIEAPPPTPKEEEGAAAGIRQLVMTSAAVGWAIDSRGRVVKTEDGAEHFNVLTKQPPLERHLLGRSYFPIHVAALDAQIAWVTEAAHDGSNGKTGQTGPIKPSPQNPFTPANNQGLSATVFATVDGGATWTETTVSSKHGPYVFRARTFPAADRVHVWMLIEPTHTLNAPTSDVYTSDDGGKTFKPRATVLTNSVITIEPDTMAGGDAFVTALHGKSQIEWDVLRSNDKGATWPIVPLTTTFGPLKKDETSRVYDPPTFWTNRDGAMLTTIWETNYTDLVMLTTHDGGASWKKTKRQRLPHNYCGGSVSPFGVSIAIANDLEDKTHILIGDNTTGAWKDVATHEIEGACSSSDRLAYMVSPTDAYLVFDPKHLVSDVAIYASHDTGKTWKRAAAKVGIQRSP